MRSLHFRSSLRLAHESVPFACALALLVVLPCVESRADEAPVARAELGDDFQISDAGPLGDTAYSVFSSDVAFSRSTDQFLVVWSGHGEESMGPELEVWGRRIDASTGDAVEMDDFRISTTGFEGDITYGGLNPGVAYGSGNAQMARPPRFLVVWYANPGLRRTASETEGSPRALGTIFYPFAQLVNVNGTLEGGETNVDGGSFLPITFGSTADDFLTNGSPGVVFDEVREEWVIVWAGLAGPDEVEIFLKRFSADLSVSSNAVQVSQMGLNAGDPSNPSYDATHPAIAWNRDRDEYFVVWHGDDHEDGEFEVFGRRIDATTTDPTPTGLQTRLSDAGPELDTRWGAFHPDVAWDSANDRYLVVWSGNSLYEGLAEGEREIFGQYVEGDGTIPPPVLRDRDEDVGSGLGERGTPIASNFRISEMGGTGNPRRGEAQFPTVLFSRISGAYVVLWHGYDGGGSTGAFEREIFGRGVGPLDGTLLGFDAFRLSQMGPDLVPEWFAKYPAVALRPRGNRLLATWRGTDDLPGAGYLEQETHGQFYRLPSGAVPDDEGHEIDQAESPAVARNPEGGVLEVYELPDEDGLGIFGRFTAADDRSAGRGSSTATFQMNHYTTGDQVAPDVTWDPGTETFLVVWEGAGADSEQGADADGIWAKVHDPAQGARGGFSLGSEFRVNSAAVGVQSGPKASGGASSARGGQDVMVVWQGPGEDGIDVWGRVFSPPTSARGGFSLGSEFQLNSFASGTQGSPDVAADESSFLVVWESEGQDGDGKGVYGKEVDPASRGGMSLGSEFRVSQGFAGDQSSPAVAGGDGEFVVAWQSPDGAGDGVYARRFGSQARSERGGMSLGSEFKVHASPAGFQSEPVVSKDDGGSFLVAWQDEEIEKRGKVVPRSRGQVFEPDGTPVGSEFALVRYDSDGQQVGFDGQLVPHASAFDCTVEIVWETDLSNAEGQTFELRSELQMNVIDGPDPVQLGDVLQYQIGVRNKGSCPSGPVLVVSDLSTSLTGAVASGCDPDTNMDFPACVGQGVPCCVLAPEGLGPGENAAFSISGTVASAPERDLAESTFDIFVADGNASLTLRQFETTFAWLFGDGFESGDVSGWSQ